MTPTPTTPTFFVRHPELGSIDTRAKMLHILVRQPTPWILLTLLVVHLVLLAATPYFTTKPDHWVVALIVIALTKFLLEWLVHGNVQHPPRGALRWLYPLMPKGPMKSHGLHHANPGDLKELFFPIQTMGEALLADWIVFGPLWLLSPRVALAAIAYAIAQALWIDIVHLTVHCHWQPRGPYGWLIAACRPRHALHHAYGKLFGFAIKGGPKMWLEITSYFALADRVFGTTHLPPWWKRLAAWNWPWKWSWARWWEAWSNVSITWW